MPIPAEVSDLAEDAQARNVITTAKFQNAQPAQEEHQLWSHLSQQLVAEAGPVLPRARARQEDAGLKFVARRHWEAVWIHPLGCDDAQPRLIILSDASFCSIIGDGGAKSKGETTRPNVRCFAVPENTFEANALVPDALFSPPLPASPDITNRLHIFLCETKLIVFDMKP